MQIVSVDWHSWLADRLIMFMDIWNFMSCFGMLKLPQALKPNKKPKGRNADRNKAQCWQAWFKILRHHLILIHDGPTCCVETHLLNWNPVERGPQKWDKLKVLLATPSWQRFAMTLIQWPGIFDSQEGVVIHLITSGCLVWKIKGLVTNLYRAWIKTRVDTFPGQDWWTGKTSMDVLLVDL